MKRRSFLIGAAGIAAGVAGTKLIDGTSSSSIHPPERSLSNHQDTVLYSVGIDGNRHQDVVLGRIPSSQMLGGKYVHNHSIITEVNTATGAVKQSAIPVGMAHAVVRLPNEHLLVVSHHTPVSLILDKNHNVVKRLTAEDGQLFGGHALVLPGTDQLLIPTRHAEPKSKDDSGYIYVYHSKTFTVQNRILSGGVHPHELRILPGGKEFAVTHYGDVDGTHDGELAFKITEPKLSIFDVKTLKLKRDYIQPDDAILTHMDIGIHGDVYAITNQYIDTESRNHHAVQRLIEKHNIPHEYAIAHTSKMENRIAIPAPFIKINPLNGERTDHIVSPETHLRSQSVAAHNASGKVFATYVFSNTLVVHDENSGSTQAIDMFEHGIHSVRGAVSIPNSDYIAVADQERGVAIINAHTLEKHKLIDVQLFQAPHIFV